MRNLKDYFIESGSSKVIGLYVTFNNNESFVVNGKREVCTQENCNCVGVWVDGNTNGEYIGIDDICEIYSIVETYPASGRPTGRTLYQGTEEEVYDFLEETPHLENLSVVFGTLEDNTYCDNRGFLQWK